MKLRSLGFLLTIGLTGIVAGTSAAIIHPPVALASCANVHYLTDAENNQGMGVGHRGNRSEGGMWIESVDAPCVRISSLFIITADQNNWAEVGWSDQEGDPSCAYSGTGPRLLWTAVDNGIYYCATQTPAALTKGDYDNFSVSDPNDNGDWQYVHSGTIFKTFTNPNMAYGNPTTNGERHSTSDQAYAEFQGLEYEDSSGWHEWTNPDGYSGVDGNTNNDPDWCNQFDSGNQIEVVSC
jgi:hypothetical protein